MFAYEILYLNTDNAVSLNYKTYRRSDRDAVHAAVANALAYKLFEVWRGDECVERGINPRTPN